VSKEAILYRSLESLRVAVPEDRGFSWCAPRNLDSEGEINSGGPVYVNSYLQYFNMFGYLLIGGLFKE